MKKNISTTLKDYLKKYNNQHKIPTSDVFLNENPHKTHYNKELLKHIDVFIDDKTFQKNPIQLIDIKKIVPTQVFLNKDNLERIKSDNNTDAYLVKYNNLYYVIDGHHRIANQIINGATHIKAFVQEV